MILREYQKEAIASIFDWFKSNNRGNPLVVAPTGSGKSLLLAGFCKQTCERWPKTRILMLAHRKELLEQNANKLWQTWPAAPIGIYSAGLNKKQFNRITIGGIQSIYNKANQLGWIDLILIDECHLLPKKGEGQYRTLIAGLMKFNPKLRIIGFTATPFRVDSGMLTSDSDSIFTDICYEIDLRYLIDQGYLSNLISKQSNVQADLTDVRTRGGEYVPTDIDKACDNDDLIGRTLNEICEQGKDRKSWILFCASVKHTLHVTQELKNRGITCAAVTGETPSGERTRILSEFKAGRIRAVLNCDVLTTGFDAPNIDLLCLLRPTKSVGIYIQMVGRGSRLSPGKENCMILDYAGNIERHGPIDQIRIKQKSGKAVNTGAPTRKCPECNVVLHISVKQCTECGYQFPEEQKHLSTASAQPILSIVQEFSIDSVRYERHEKEGKPPSMRAIYGIGYALNINQFLCFDHGGFATMKARQWWVKATGEKHGVPKNTNEALSRIDELGKPIKLFAKKDGKYWQILNVEFNTTVDKFGELYDGRERGIPF